MPNFRHPIINAASKSEQKEFFRDNGIFSRLAEYVVVMPIKAIAAPVVNLIAPDEKQWLPEKTIDKVNNTAKKGISDVLGQNDDTYQYVMEGNPLTYLLQFLEKKQLEAVRCLGDKKQTHLNGLQKAFIFLSETALIIPRILTALINPIAELGTAITNCFEISEKQEKESDINRLFDSIKSGFSLS